MTESELLGKVIKEINLDGNGIWLMTEDGYCLDYSSSDGGYSSWELYKNEASGVECMEVPREEQEMKCDCFREQYGKTVCYGTKEIDPCSCNGDKSKCDFYPEVREKANPMTNGDRIRAKEDAALAEFGAELIGLAMESGIMMPERELTVFQMKAIKHRFFCVLCEWLKQPVKD